ncbi:MAG TPA: hypothetical protein VD767_08630 [Thermomicrobiales bacterium]|nr:hypothetical protein [Thermomicrobiales bacterium]
MESETHAGGGTPGNVTRRTGGTSHTGSELAGTMAFPDATTIDHRFGDVPGGHIARTRVVSGSMHATPGDYTYT